MPLLTLTKIQESIFVSCGRTLTRERRCWWSVSCVLTMSQRCSRSTSVTFLTLCFARTSILPSFKLRVSFAFNRSFISYSTVHHSIWTEYQRSRLLWSANYYITKSSIHTKITDKQKLKMGLHILLTSWLSPLVDKSKSWVM